jgi:lysophospholipase L1-like esterase
MTSRRRWLLFAAATIVIAAGAATAVLLAVDVYLHGRYERSAGFNVWGYRGSSVGRKKSNEYRVVMLGGSAAYGYGVASDEAIPAVLQQMLRSQTQSPVFTVVNLGYNNEGAYSFRATLDDYAWLKYDLVLLYEGYNDLSVDKANTQVFRHDSPVFRLTGYLPIFPIVFKEKAAALVGGGDPGALYRNGAKTQFHASLAAKTSATMLTATADIAQSLEAQLGRVASEPVPHVEDGSHTGCERWSRYCRSIELAIETARRHRASVIVATQPYLRTSAQTHAVHMQQQSALGVFLARRFSADGDVRYVNLGDAVDLEDARFSFDHMHLQPAGNARVASRLVEPVLAIAAQRHQKVS